MRDPNDVKADSVTTRAIMLLFKTYVPYLFFVSLALNFASFKGIITFEDPLFSALFHIICLALLLVSVFLYDKEMKKIRRKIEAEE